MGGEDGWSSEEEDEEAAVAEEEARAWEEAEEDEEAITYEEDAAGGEMQAPAGVGQEDEDDDEEPLSPVPSDDVGFGAARQADGRRDGSTTPIERQSSDDSGGGDGGNGTPPVVGLDPALLFGVSSRVSGRSGWRNRDRRSRLEAEDRLRIEVRRLSGIC